MDKSSPAEAEYKAYLGGLVSSLVVVLPIVIRVTCKAAFPFVDAGNETVVRRSAPKFCGGMG